MFTERKRELSVTYKDANPIISGLLPHLTLITSLEALFPNTATLGELRVSKNEFEEVGEREHKHQYITSILQ